MVLSKTFVSLSVQIGQQPVGLIVPVTVSVVILFAEGAIVLYCVNVSLVVTWSGDGLLIILIFGKVLFHISFQYTNCLHFCIYGKYIMAKLDSGFWGNNQKVCIPISCTPI